MADDVEVRYAKEHIPSNLQIRDPRKEKPRWGGISLSTLLQKAEELTSGVITIPKVHPAPIRCMCFSATTGTSVASIAIFTSLSFPSYPIRLIRFISYSLSSVRCLCFGFLRQCHISLGTFRLVMLRPSTWTWIRQGSRSRSR